MVQFIAPVLDPKKEILSLASDLGSTKIPEGKLDWFRALCFLKNQIMELCTLNVSLEKERRHILEEKEAQDKAFVTVHNSDALVIAKL